MNRQQISALVLLDLSAAFDTIDHTILTNRLKTCFEISDSAFSLLSSYLSCRSQSVTIGDEFSSELPLLRGSDLALSSSPFTPPRSVAFLMMPLYNVIFMLMTLSSIFLFLALIQTNHYVISHQFLTKFTLGFALTVFL